MARIFTTKFSFNEQVYDAIVTVISSSGKLNFDIKVLDAELYDLIPNGQIHYAGEDGFVALNTKNDMAQSLIQSIALSIEDHLVGRL